MLSKKVLVGAFSVIINLCVDLLFQALLSDHYLELELNIKFPTCWDGERVESTDQSHVAYALECGKHHNECFDFDCPDTHPVR